MSSTFFSNPRSNPELKCLREIALLPRTPQLQDYFSGVMAVLSQYFSVGYGALILQGPQKEWLQVESPLWNGEGGASPEFQQPDRNDR